MSSAGIIFTATDVPMRDQYGNQVMCTRCGGTLFDVTLRGDQADRIECASAECGQPAGVPADNPAEVTA